MNVKSYLVYHTMAGISIQQYASDILRQREENGG